MASLTRRQKEIYDFISHYISKKNIAPTFNEIKKHFKLSAVSTVHQHVEVLINKGFLKRGSSARDMELSNLEMVQIPLLGIVSAGQPLELIEGKEIITVPKNRLSIFQDVFALRVKGNSMVEENIGDGDLVFVKKQNWANNGDKVVALVGRNTTLKTFYNENGRIRLQPANKNISPIFLNKNEVQIQGVVIDVLKSLPVYGDAFKMRQTKTSNLPEISLNKIYHGDCLDVMSRIKDETIDLIFADPPYNLSKSNFKMKFTKSGGTDLDTNKGKWDQFSEDEFEEFTRKWLAECSRILKKNGSLWVAGTYHNIYLTGYLIQKLGFQILNEVLWHKSDATPNLSCTRFVADHENFIWARKGKGNVFNYEKMKEINGGKQMRSIWTKGKTTGGKKIHPTQKPEWLLERIILATSNPGHVIFDPFMGSGTTAVVAKRLKRSYLGSELDYEYYVMSQKRLKNTE